MYLHTIIFLHISRTHLLVTFFPKCLRFLQNISSHLHHFFYYLRIHVQFHFHTPNSHVMRFINWEIGIRVGVYVVLLFSDYAQFLHSLFTSKFEIHTFFGVIPHLFVGIPLLSGISTFFAHLYTLIFTRFSTFLPLVCTWLSRHFLVLHDFSALQHVFGITTLRIFMRFIIFHCSNSQNNRTNAHSFTL